MTGREQEREYKSCQCPYCSGVTQASMPLCQVCGATIVRCAGCGKVLAQDATRCPSCGAEVKRASRLPGEAR